MAFTTMLLVSRDAALIDAVRSVTRSVDDLRLLVLPDVDEACSFDDWVDIGLVAVHIQEDRNAADRLLTRLGSRPRQIPSIVLGEEEAPDLALKVLRLGASDYLWRPLDLGRLAYLIDLLTVKARRRAAAATKGAASDAPDPLYYQSAEMGRMMDQIRRIAPQESTILLSGETGTGKTRLARVIHELSPRREEPFLVVNCGALSSNLIESEMFGHVRGSFTGADRDRVGKFADVGKGTLLLDEIDSLPLDVQAKLLRVVEDRVFEPVGSNKTQPVRARLIAACNRPLDKEVACGRFRSDLYYRLNVVGFMLPPLRERIRAVGPLARRFVAEFAPRYGWDGGELDEAALSALEAHDWPGNIRELRNVIERSIALSQGPVIGLKDLPDNFRSPSEFTPSPQDSAVSIESPALRDSTLAQIKKQAELARITEALEKHRNNRLRAASELGISRMTLYKKLYKYGLMTDTGGRTAPPPIV